MNLHVYTYVSNMTIGIIWRYWPSFELSVFFLFNCNQNRFIWIINRWLSFGLFANYFDFNFKSILYIPFPIAYCCSKSIILMWTTPFFSCINVSQWVTLPLPGPPKHVHYCQKKRKEITQYLIIFLFACIDRGILPNTKITGTLGGSNFTLPAFCMGKFALERILEVADLSPPPFHSLPGSSDSCAAEFASVKFKLFFS